MAKHTFHRPRRMLIAAALFLLLGGSSWALVGTAAADDGDEQGTIRLPSRHVGDVGSYEGSDDRAVRFEWLPVAPFRDADGKARQAEVLELRTPAGNDQEFIHLVRLDRGSGAPLSATLGAGVSYATSGDTSVQVTSMRHEFGASWLPCGYRNSAQGAAVERLVVFGSCAPGGAEATVLGIEPWGDGDALVAEVREGSLTSTMWFTRDVPVPVLVRTTYEGGHVREQRLETFSAGTEPFADAPAVPDVGLPGVGSILFGRTGPSEDPLGIEYDLATAIEEAAAHPDGQELRSFMDAHPDWFVAAAETLQAASNTDIEGWSFEVSSDTSSLRGWIYHARGDLVPDASGLPVVGEAQRTESVHVHVTRQDEAAGPRPGQLPDPADVAAAWMAYSDDGPATSWGFRTGHCHGTCVADPEVWAGTAAAGTMAIGHSQTPSVLGSPAESEQSESSSLVWGQGRAVALIEQHRVEERQGNGGPLGSAQAPEAPDADRDNGLPLTADLSWSRPGAGVAAGAGAIGLLAAAVYYFLPMLKAAPAWGLFSRVRRERVLDHPLRTQVMEAIEASPGIHHNDLARVVGRGHSAVEHHVRKLVEARLVEAPMQGGYRCYFPRGRADRNTMAAAGATKARGAREFLAAVTASPGCTAKQAAAAAGIAPATAHHHLKRLQEAGLIEGRRGARGALALFPAGQAKAA